MAINTHKDGHLEYITSSDGTKHYLNAEYLDGHSYDDISKAIGGKADKSDIPTNFATTTQLANKLDKNNASGTGSFTWAGADGSSLNINFKIKSPGADEVGLPTEYSAMSLSAAPYGNTALELFTETTNGDASIKLDQAGHSITLGSGGITTNQGSSVWWPEKPSSVSTADTCKFLTTWDLDSSSTDKTYKVVSTDFFGKISPGLIRPLVSQYASESDLPGLPDQDPYDYGGDAKLYVTTDTNSIYRYNKTDETYIKLGPDTSTLLDKGTSSTVVNQVVYNPVELKKGLTGTGVFTWSKTLYDSTGTMQLLDGCRIVLTQGYASPSIEFATKNSTTPYLSAITNQSVSFANTNLYPKILWHADIMNISNKPFFLTSDLLGKNNYIAQLDNAGKIPAAQIPSNYLDKGDSTTTAAQTVYNPVELKKALVVPSVKGEAFTVSGNAQNTFALGGSITQESGKTLRSSQLMLGGSADSTLYKSSITQDSNGYLSIVPKDPTNTANALWWTESNGWRIGDNRIVTGDVFSNKLINLQSNIRGQADDWLWLGKVAENVYTMNLSEIKPGFSGTTTGATCLVSINTFRKRIHGKQLFKTVIDATCRCYPFDLKHLNVDITPGVHAGSKWFMPRMFVSRGVMASDAFTHMMAVLYADRAHVGIAVDECSVFRDMSTSLGNLNASGSVSPIYSMNADGFSLFATLMELDRDNANKNIYVSGAHYRVTIFHPNPVL